MADELFGNWRTILRIGLGIALEYAVLALIEDAAIGVKVATAIIAALGLATLQVEQRLRTWYPPLFGICLTGLAALYLAVVIYGIEQSPKASAFFILPPIWKGAVLGSATTLACVVIVIVIARVIRRRASLLMISGDEDAPIMQQRLPIIGVHPCGEPQNLTKDAPFIEFEITLINASVFGVAWEAVKGYLCIDEEPQEEDMLKPRKLQQFERGKHVSCAVRQRVTPRIAKIISEREKDVRFDLCHVTLCFSFNHRGKPRNVEIPVSFRTSYVTWDHAKGRMKSAPWEAC